MKKSYIILLLLLTTNYCWSQYELPNMANDTLIFDASKHKRIYQFTIPYTSLSVYLTEFSNGKVRGTVNINLDKADEPNLKDFQGRILINKSTVKRILLQLDNLKFEEFTNADPAEPCAVTLDGDRTFFELKTSTLSKKLHFDSISIHKKPYDDCEGNKKAEQVLILLNRELDFDEQYKELKSLLANGKYSYWSGNAIVTFYVDN